MKHFRKIGRFFLQWPLSARISRGGSTAGAQEGMSAALRLFGLSFIPLSPSRRAPYIHALLRPLATKLHEIFRLVIGIFPLTKTGIAFLVLFGIAVGVYGIRRMDFVVLAAGAAGALTIFVLLLFTIIGASFLFFASRRAVTPGVLDLVTNRPQSTGCRVRYPGWIPCTIARWSWENPGHGDATVSVKRENGRHAEMVTPARRCVADRVTRRFFVRDIFGLTEISWRRTEVVKLRVLPDVGLLARMPPPFGMSDGDDMPEPLAAPGGDRVDMRPYVPGDSLRMVLWKVYARSGRMMVRVAERSVAEHRRGCGYLVTDVGDDAVSAAARIAVERGLLGDDWRFGADGVRNYAAETDEAVEIIALSGEADCDNRAKEPFLGDFLAKMRSDGYQSCVLFMPPDPAAWDYAAGQMAGCGSMRIQVVIGVEVLRPERKDARGFVRRAVDWFLRPEIGTDPTLEEITRMVSSVPGLCRNVLVAERRTGRLHRNIRVSPNTV